MKLVPCGVCKATTYQPVLTLRDLLHDLPGEFHLVRCDRCGFLYLNPQPEWEELKLYYSGDYPPYRLVTHKDLLGTIQLAGFRRKAQLVRQFAQAGRLLDVGCGTGQFLAQMKILGQWDCQGIEPIRQAAETARQLAGVPVLQAALSEAHFEDNYFDVVSLWDVLEHVPDPQAELEEIFRILKPGGVAFLGTPDPEGVGAHLFGSFWSIYEAPRHLGLFPRKMMERTLAGMGFTLLGVRYLSGEYYAFFSSLAAYFSRRGPRWAASACRWALQSTGLRLITFPLFYWPAVLGVGSSPIYIARKKT